MAGFWAGFGTQFSKDVGEIRKELREDSRTRKNYMDQYGAKTIAAAQKKSDEILSMVNESVAMGIDEQAMLGIFQKSGAKGIRMFHKALLERPNLSIDDYQSISNMGREWVKDTDLDLSEVILQAMNVYHDPDAKRPERDQNFLQGIISGGYGDDSWMDEPRFAGGLTARDVKRIEAGTTQNPTAGGLDVIGMLGPKALSDTADRSYESLMIEKFKKVWLVEKNKQVLVRDAFNPGTPRYIAEQEKFQTLMGMQTNGFQTPDLAEFAKSYDPDYTMYRYIDSIERERPASMSINPMLAGVYGNRNQFADNLKLEGKVFETEEQAQEYVNRLGRATTVVIEKGRLSQIFNIAPDA